MNGPWQVNVGTLVSPIEGLKQVTCAINLGQLVLSERL